MSANDKQIAGNHYKQFKNFEPWDVVTAWKLGYLDGTALKYIARWRNKNGIEDLKKAIHFLEKLIEVELASPSTSGRMEHRSVSASVQTEPWSDEPDTRFFPPLEAVGTPSVNTFPILRDDNG